MNSVHVPSGADVSGLRVLQSRCVFTATSDEAFDGFIAVRGNRIEAVGSAADAAPYVKAADEVIDFGDRTLMPGLVDVHTFYTGWQFRRTGANLLDVENTAEIVSRLVQWRAQDGLRAFALGQNLPSSFAVGEAADELKALLDAECGDGPVVVFAEEASTCVLNTAAYARYGFSPDACYAEMIWRLLADVLSLPESRAGYDARVRAVRQRKVDDAELASEADGRLGDLRGERPQPASLSSREEHGDAFFRCHQSLPFIRSDTYRWWIRDLVAGGGVPVLVTAVAYGLPSCALVVADPSFTRARSRRDTREWCGQMRTSPTSPCCAGRGGSSFLCRDRSP